MTFKGIQHKLDIAIQDGRLLEDKFFYVIRVENPRGTLIESTPGSLNHWYTKDEILKLDRFEGVDEIIDMVTLPGIHFVERNYTYNLNQY